MFNASLAPVRQSFTWDCSAASLAWLLSSAGSPTSEADAINLLGSAVNPSVGLTDASGAGIVAALVGSGVGATNGPLGFDAAKGLAGSAPLMIGGAAFNHWTGVSAVDGDALVLANPAPGWMGVGDRMSRAQFSQLGPFYGVWLTGTTTPSGGLSVASPWQFSPWLLIGGAVAVLLLVDDIDSNPDFFWRGGVIHPIRDSADYDPEVDEVQRTVAHRRSQAERYRGVNRERENQLSGGVERPPWAVGVSNAALEGFAKEHGENARSPGWWERAGLYSQRGKSGQRVSVMGRRVAAHETGELQDVVGYLRQDRADSADESIREARMQARAQRRKRGKYDAPRTRSGAYADLPF